MYVLNRIVGVAINPMMATVALGLVAYISCWWNGRRIAKSCVFVAVAWLWFWMMPLTSRIVGAPLEREFLVNGRVPLVEEFPGGDAIVLLGGSMGAEAKLSPYAEMRTSADRVWQAARLYKAGKAKKIIATGDLAEESTLKLLLDFGVDKDDIVFWGARNTEEEAHQIAKVGPKRILLVTSAWHMKRARLMFAKYASDIEVICAPADFENSFMAVQPFSLYELLPDYNAFCLNCISLHEWVGMFGYKLFRK